MQTRFLPIALTILMAFSAGNPALGQSDAFSAEHPRDQYERERTAVEELLKTIVGLVEQAALSPSSEAMTGRLRGLSSRLMRLTPPDESNAMVLQQDGGDGGLLRADDLEQAQRLVKDAIDQIVALRHELRLDGNRELAERTSTIENGLIDALAMLRRIQAKPTGENEMTKWMPPPKTEGTDRREGQDKWLRPGKYNDEAEEEQDWGAKKKDDRDYSWDDHDPELDHDHDYGHLRRRWRSGATADPGDAIGAFAGEFGYGWPYRVIGVYRPIPAFRHNRVDGFVAGIRRLPLSWDSYDRGRVYGYGGYAFGSDKWQYEIGAEAKTGSRKVNAANFKAGGAYRRTTTTNDLWKSSWAENSLAAFFFNYDFFDYYEVEGWTGYAALQLSRYFQVTGGYRSEDYFTLMPETTWSLFRGKHFRSNPSIAEGRMNSVVVVAEGGWVQDYDFLPAGAVFRVEAEFGKGFGGDFEFNRFVADGRWYIPVDRSASLNLRLVAGNVSSDAPFQKVFTIGGIGTMRGYGQNVFVGTRMLVGNAEYSFTQDWLWDDLLVSGFFDAGWIDRPGSKKFDFDDVYPTAGVAVGVLDRTLRLELGFPLKDAGAGRDPSLWVRVNPSF